MRINILIDEVYMNRLTLPAERDRAFLEMGLDKLSKNLSPADFEIFEYKKGESIIKCDIDMEYMFFQYSGKAKVYLVTENGKSLLLRFYYKESIMGDLEFVNGQKSTCYVDAIDDTRVLTISYDKLSEKVGDDVDFYKHIAKSIANKLSQNSNSATINQLYTLKSKICSYLSGLSMSSGSYKKVVELEKLKDVADLLGTSYRHLLRTLSELEEEGIISHKGKKVTILDFDMLDENSADIYK